MVCKLFFYSYVKKFHHSLAFLHIHMFLILRLQILCSQGLAADFHSINHLLATTSRLIYDMKGDYSPHMAWDDPSLIDYYTRHLFWIEFVCDKDFGLATDLPLMPEDS